MACGKGSSDLGIGSGLHVCMYVCMYVYVYVYVCMHVPNALTIPMRNAPVMECINVEMI